MLAREIASIDARFGYLAELPWAYSRADTIEGAKEVMRLLRKHPLEHMDCFTRRTQSTIGGDIERRANGEDASPALVAEVQRICESCLNESPGEGLVLA